MSPNQLPQSTGVTVEQIMMLIHETDKNIKEVTEQSKITLAEIKELREQSKVEIKELREQSKEQSKATEKIVKEIAEQSKVAKVEIKELREQSKVTDKIVKESAEQSKLEIKELREQSKATDKLVKEVAKQIGSLGNRFGELAEHLVAPGIAERFNELGYHFSAYSPSGVKIKDPKTQRVIAEIDLLLENSDTIAVVEIKAKPRQTDIENHIERIEAYGQERNKNGEKQKKIIGAIAGAVFYEEEKQEVLNAGLFVITQTGDTVKIEIPPNFTPRIF
jgi:hypothetical protein